MSEDTTQQQEHYAAGMAAHMGLEFTLTVHLDDGTTKEIPCVGRITNIQKEQDHDDLRS